MLGSFLGQGKGLVEAAHSISELIQIRAGQGGHGPERLNVADAHAETLAHVLDGLAGLAHVPRPLHDSVDRERGEHGLAEADDHLTRGGDRFGRSGGAFRRRPHRRDCLGPGLFEAGRQLSYCATKGQDRGLRALRPSLQRRDVGAEPDFDVVGHVRGLGISNCGRSTRALAIRALKSSTEAAAGATASAISVFQRVMPANASASSRTGHASTTFESSISALNMANLLAAALA